VVTFWLGRSGTVLVALPHPGRGIKATLTIPGKATGTIGGGQTVDRAPTGRRTYELDWTSLTPDQHSIVEEFQLGARGPGPHVLLDPYRRNHLTANQSAATSVSNDTTGFTPSASESLSSVTTPARRGPRALAWTIPSSSTAGILTFTPPNGLTRWPTPAGATWTASVWLRGGGTNPIVTAGLAFVWRDAGDAILSTPTGTTIATASGAYAQASQTPTAPAGAVGFDLQLHVTPASVGAGGSIVYVDQPQLDLYNSVRAWVVGTGVPLVSAVIAETGYRAPIRRAATLTLVEVG
jgi:hypothetical protein